MRRLVLKIIYIAAVFVLALVIFERAQGGDEGGSSLPMESARLPIVRLKLPNGSTEASLHGYLGQMDVRSMRGGILPVDADRRVSLEISSFGEELDGFSYEIRDITGDDLVEQTEFEVSWNASGDTAEAELKLKDLLESGREYMLIVRVGTPIGEAAYYSRVVSAGEEVMALAIDALDFASFFSESTWSDGESITQYLEPNREGDNTSFYHVDIHSSLSQVTWGELPIAAHDKPDAALMDIRGDIATVKLKGGAAVRSEADPSRRLELDITEVFRIRQGISRLYLLDYDRYTTYRYAGAAADFGGGKLELNINDENIHSMESEGGSVFVFSAGDRLFSFNKESSELEILFSFEDGENSDERCVWDEHDYRILDVDENGSADFIVAGYMNRGLYEGRVGVLLCRYDASIKEVRERVFVPADVSPDILRAQIGRMAHLGEGGELYLMLGDDIVRINPENKEVETLIEGAAGAVSFLSESGALFAWEDGDDITIFRFGTGDEIQATAERGTVLVPLGFMQEDLVYGVVNRDDILKDQAGNDVYAMETVRIRDADGNILENYTSPGNFVVSADIEGNVIRLNRVERNESTGFYEEAEGDQIVNTLEVRSKVNRVYSVVSGIWERVVEIDFRTQTESSQVRVAVPSYAAADREDVSGIVGMAAGTYRTDGYYVYYNDGSVGAISADEAAAVTAADAAGGVVTDSDDVTVWERRSLAVRNQIMAITRSAESETPSEGEGGVAWCLKLMLGHRGINRDVAELIEEGRSLSQILEGSLTGCRALTLNGCDMQTMLYYVDRDIPVLVSMRDGSALLMIGFNDTELVVADPQKTGERVYKITRSQGIRLFGENGNRFLTYYESSPSR